MKRHTIGGVCWPFYNWTVSISLENFIPTMYFSIFKPVLLNKMGCSYILFLLLLLTSSFSKIYSPDGWLFWLAQCLFGVIFRVPWNGILDVLFSTHLCVLVLSNCHVRMSNTPEPRPIWFLSTFNGITSGCVMQSKDSISIPKSTAISIAAFASILCDFIPWTRPEPEPA